MKSNSDLKTLLAKIEAQPSISDKFHKRTSNNKIVLQVNNGNWPEAWTTIHFKTYPRLSAYNLNFPKKLSKIDHLFLKRKSQRNFSGSSISFQQLSKILYLAGGKIDVDKKLDNSRRPYPSAGGRYPLEIYPLVLNCRGIEKGLYHFNVRDNLLELLVKKDLTKWISKTIGGETWITKSSVVMIITGVLDRTRVKYEDRGYKYVLIEAGHLGQNICLISTKENLGVCTIGGFIDSQVNTLLDIDKTNEVALYLAAIGKYD